MTTAALSSLAALGLVAGVAVRNAVWLLAVDQPPRTRCPNCGFAARGQAPPIHILTGACAHCGSSNYPPPLLPELLCAAGFTLSGWIGGGALRVASLCWLVAFGLAAVLVDTAFHRLPDLLTWPCLAGVLALSCGQALALGSAPAALRTVLASAGMAVFFLVLAATFNVGLADAKLAASLGAALGYATWNAVIVGAAAGLCLAGLQAAASIATRRSSATDHLALGPPLLAGTLLVLATAAH